MSSNTVRLHRVLGAPPERIYRAFVDAGALAKWLPPHGYFATVHHLDARVGGTFRMSFTQLDSGQSHAFGGEYLELEPGRRIRHIDRFDDPGLPGQMTVTVVLAKVANGTDVTIEQEGIPEAIPVEDCYVGWQQSLQLLTQPVEDTGPAS